jgi:hypothetical protein
MFEISFVPSSMRRPAKKQLAELEYASEMDLRYEYFESDINLAMGEFGTESLPGVTSLDFVFCLLLAAREVRNGDRGIISFTENDLEIYFDPSDGEVAVTRSWDPVSGSCDIGEFLAEAARFCGEILEFIVQQYPTFRENPAYLKLNGMVDELAR